MVKREPPNKILTTEDLNLIVKYWEQGYSPRRINEEILNKKFKTTKSIVDWLKKAGVYETRDRIFYSKTKNHTYFDVIDTERKAYFIGLLQADGWIHAKSDNSKQIGLSLWEKDKYIIEIFKQELDTENKIVHRVYNDPNKHDSYQLQIDSPILYDSLVKYHVSGKYDKQFIPANIPNNLLNHYIRGLFDGDGTVCNTPKTKNIHVGFLGSLQCMSQLTFYLSYIYNIYQTQPFKLRPKSEVELYGLRYSEKEDIEKIYNMLYNNATIYLKRKKEVFDEWFNNQK